MKENSNYTNIVLIGFMGVGKGTLARYIAKKNDLIVIDTDDIIESFENRKIKKIFKKDGEEYFRNLEKKVAKWLEKSVSNSLISTGGGFYQVDNLNKIGKVIYLKSSFDGILNRINKLPNAKSKLKKRPLLQDRVKAKELFNFRDSEYHRVANIIIDVENKNIEEIYQNILEKITF